MQWPLASTADEEDNLGFDCLDVQAITSLKVIFVAPDIQNRL